MAWLSPDCRGSFARVFPLDDVPVGYRPVARRQAKHGLERDMSIKSSVVAEDEFVQVRIDVLAAETGAEGTWSETPAWFRTKLFVASDASIALSFSDVSDAHQFFTSPLRSSNNLDYRA